MSLKIDWSVFDSEWYKKTYHSVLSFFEVDADSDVYNFYEHYGAALQHSPNMFFDEEWYLTRYPAVQSLIASGDYKSGFEHYKHLGFESYSPHWLFDEDYYKRTVLDASSAVLAQNGFRNGYDHYLNQGARALSQPCLFFDPAFFLKEEPEFIFDVEEGVFIAFLRCLSEPRFQHTRLSWYFDPVWYAKHYADYAAEPGSWCGPLHHYLANITPENYDPNPYFSEKFYRQTYEDVAAAVVSGAFRSCYEHFIKFGQYEFRQPAPDVKLRQYIENPKVKSEVAAQKYPSVFVHYMAHDGMVNETGYTEEEVEYISKSVYQSMCRARLPLLMRAGIDFTYTSPDISVIIVAHNNFAMTLSALFSLRENYKGSIQLILVDSGSSDEVRHIERYVQGAHVIRALGNIGFLLGCNEALQHVKADFTLYLNNDLELMPHAIDRALARFAKEPKAGAVGAKLFRTNGLLQEAGCIVWQDGGVVGYLRDQMPDIPEANYVRSVDFCSGAFLMVRTALLKELAGFDTDYAPAYFEETDLCVRLNKYNMEVVYDPAVVVLHYEYGTSGNHESGQMMAINFQKFKEKNNTYIATKLQRSEHNIVKARSTRTPTKRVLFIEDYLPFRHLGSGFTRSHDIVTSMVEQLACDVTLYPVFRPIGMVEDTYTAFPDRAEVMWNKGLEDLAAFLHSRPGYYDVVWIARTHNAERLKPILAECTAALGRATVVLDTEAVAAGRTMQKLALQGETPQHSLEEMLQKEFRAAQVAQQFIAVSAQDAQTLRTLGLEQVNILGHQQQVRRFTPGYTNRHDILFVGAIHDLESPNLESLLWFVKDVLPVLEQILQEDFKLRVCGYINPTIDLPELLAHPRVECVGRVEDISPYYESHRIFVAPTRFAAGIPYKLHEAAANGLPIVASDILCKQVGWVNGTDIVAAQTGNPADFAQCVKELYQNRELWERVRRNALRRIVLENNTEKYIETIRSILTFSKV
ncbi:glycosyltransferase [Acetobacter orientalis]|uniref:glycosyltransferase n=1 Tax=Acetobacter orientalis TaxID=146474 RepID=UPI0020A3E3CA|nr:glycosyltransferase [Acetobacter orientalis]MCP1220664.1 glycosyltransferase [Acetobacter orientalis]